MRAKYAQVLNLGLPKTGTTSTDAALSALNFKSSAVVARLVQTHVMDWDSSKFPTLPMDDKPRMYVCSVRSFDAWLDSAKAHFPRASEELLTQVYADHREWVNDMPFPVGFFDVQDGMRGFYGALRAACVHEAMPHLNARP